MKRTFNLLMLVTLRRRFVTLRNSVRQFLTKDSREEAMFAHVSVVTTSQTHLLQKKPLTAPILNANMIGCSEGNRTLMKITSSAAGAEKGVTSVLMIVHVLTL